MKHRILYSTLLGALLSVLVPGCISQLSETPGQMKAPESFTAEMGDADGTKTTLADDKTTVLWRPYDRINVFFSGFNLGQYTNYAEENSPIALFVGNATTFVGATVEDGINKCYWAIYPHSYDDNTSDGYSITTLIRNKQIPVPGNIEEGSLVTVARSETTALQFYHVLGGIKFSLTHEGVQQVEFKGNNGEPIAGKVKVTMNDANHPVIDSFIEGESKTSITMTVPEGETFKTGIWYYLCCAPVELTQGFTLTFRSETETGEYTYNEPISVKRAIWGTLTDVDDAVAYEAQYNNLYRVPVNEIRYTTADGTLAEFAGDPTLRAHLVSNTYEDGLGTLLFDSPVTEIKGRLFPYNTYQEGTWLYVAPNITSLELPNSLEELGDDALRDCSQLSSFDIPRRVKSIGNGAFANCGSLESVEIPEGVASIGENAFEGCTSLSYMRIPDSVQSIGTGAFYNCTNLWGFECQFAEDDGRCLIVNGNLIALARTSDYHYTLPSTVIRVKSQSISNWLSELIVPSTVQIIEEAAICTSINSLSVSGETQLEEGVFSENGSCGTFIVEGVYNDRVLVSNNIVIRCSDYFGRPNYYNLNLCGTRSCIIPSGVTRIGKAAFNDASNLGSVTIPEGVASIGDQAFGHCSYLTSITIPETVTSIGEGAFEGCRLLENIVLPPQLRRIEVATFSSSGIKNILLPDGIQYIGDRAFGFCSALESIVLPSSLTTLGNTVFWICNNLISVTVPCDTPPSIGQNVFLFTHKDLVIYVPAESVDTYKAATNWSEYANRIQAIPASGSVYAVELDHTSLSIKKNNTADLVATVKPSTATDKSVTWSSSDESVATVDQSGKITAVGYGEAVITVTTNDGQKTAQCKVEVPEPDYDGPVIESFTFSPQEIDITTEAQTVTVKFHITDKSGVQSGPYVYIQNQDNVSGTQQTGQTKLESGTTKDGIYSVAITIPAGLQPGEWRISANSIRDIHNNSSSSFLTPTSEKKTLTVINNQ